VNYLLIICLSVVFLLLSGTSQLFSQNVAVVRDTLPTENSVKTEESEFKGAMSDEDLEYYGLEEKSQRIWSTSVLFSGTYDSNIFISENGEVDDFIWTISPEITLEPYHLRKNFPHYFKASYNPAFQFFTANPSEDSIEHSGMASYLYKGEVVTFNAKHQSSTESGASRDVGGRSERDIHNTQISANFRLADKWSILWNNEQKLRFYENQNDQHTWSTEGFLLHQPTGKFTVGLGTKLGWTDINGSPNQDFQQGLIKLSYVPHPDWTLDVTGGAEVRSFQDSAGVGTRVTPVAQGLVSYRIFSKTRINLSGYRRVLTSSGLAGSNYVVSGGAIGVQHQFLDRFNYGGSFGVEYADYYNTSTTIPTLQRDDLFHYTTHQLQYRYNEHLAFAVSYTWMMNDSNIADFTSNRAAISTTLTY
jgi:hypothetical protein